MVALNNKTKYLVAVADHNVVLTNSGNWVELALADDLLNAGELLEFDDLAEAEVFVQELIDNDVPAQLVAENEIRLGLPSIEENYELALSALCSSAAICLVVIQDLLEKAPDTNLPLVRDYYNDLRRCDKIIRLWAQHIESQD